MKRRFSAPEDAYLDCKPAMTRHIQRYVLAAVISPLLMTMAVAVLLLTLEQMLRLFDVVVVEHGPVAVVWRMLLNLLPEYLGLSIPIGFLLGVVIGFRRLSQSNALDAMHSAGVSLRSIVAPIFGLSVLLMGATVIVVGFIQPYSAYEFERLGFLMQHGAFGLRIKAGQFTPIDKNTVIRIASISPAGAYQGIYAERCAARRSCIVTTAERAVWVFSQDGDRQAALRLYNGRQINISDPSAPEGVLDFKSMDFPISRPDAPAFRRRGEMSGETPLPVLARIAFSPTSARNKEYLEDRAQLHWIALQGLTFLAIPFLGASFGIVGKRRGGALNFAISLFVLIAYIQLLKAGALRADGGASPWLVMWPSFILFFTLSLGAFYVAAERPGGFGLRLALPDLAGAGVLPRTKRHPTSEIKPDKKAGGAGTQRRRLRLARQTERVSERESIRIFIE
ncbi:MAG: LptF/LptG family permease [Alphaproteobacteria bacterium]|nr:LptF/LptG family permease [Alphaproteobacteria bacterium]